jgi:hypothetical protein
MPQALSIRAAGRSTRRVHIQPWLLALALLALIIALEAAAFAYTAPMLDPAAPVFVT